MDIKEWDWEEWCDNDYNIKNGKGGYIYVPYIPMQITPTPITGFTPAKGIMSRYSTKIVNSKYYSKINVTDTV